MGGLPDGEAFVPKRRRKFDTGPPFARGKEKDYVYERVDSRRRPVYDMDFNRTEIKKVVVRRKAIRAGAFREIMDNVWTVGLQFHNNFELAVFEEKEVTKALLDAQVLTGRFRTPVEFADAVHASLAEKPGIKPGDGLVDFL